MLGGVVQSETDEFRMQIRLAVTLSANPRNQVGADDLERPRNVATSTSSRRRSLRKDIYGEGEESKRDEQPYRRFREEYLNAERGRDDPAVGPFWLR
jgi:hypothetical protein